MRDAFVKRLTLLAAANPRVFLMTGDLGFGVLTDFAEKFPSQFLNVGVAEQNMIGVATGLALEGRIVFAYSIGNFSTLRCLEQIRNDACYHDANVKVVCVGGGFSYGALGMSHHATEDIGILRVLPGITVSVPGDVWEAAEATASLAATPGVGYLRLDKSHASGIDNSQETFQLGKIRTVRQGRDITLACCGGILGVVMAAAQELEKDGITCRVLSVHTIKPMDQETICQAAVETGGIVTVEEHTVDGGLGGVVAETCLENGCIPKKFARMGLKNTFAAVVGSQEYLRQRYELDSAAIVTRVRVLLQC
ncbi:MAG: transketolase [Magnetococcales bacterium]|nr:transketolase [Magnetococcales bacterium]NGZ29497.1 transketolase [Magnetococcales bacterium]